MQNLLTKSSKKLYSYNKKFYLINKNTIKQTNKLY